MKDISEIRDRLMTMEANDLAFDCRKECIDLCDAFSELKSLVEEIVVELNRANVVREVRNG
jgi:hypothetical protein